MAYYRSFYFDYKSLADISYRLEIYDNQLGSNNSSYSNKEGKLGKTGGVIKFGSDGGNLYAPLKASTLEIPFIVFDTLSKTYINQLKTNREERDKYVHLYQETVVGTATPTTRPIFTGVLLMDLSDDPD